MLKFNKGKAFLRPFFVLSEKKEKTNKVNKSDKRRLKNRSADEEKEDAKVSPGRRFAQQQPCS